MRRRTRDRAVEAVLRDRPIPEGGPIDQEEAEALRAAIELKAGLAPRDQPDPAFVAGLHRRLGGEVDSTAAIDRRTLLAAAGAVAAGVAGFGIDRALLAGDRSTHTGPAAASSVAQTIEPNQGVWVAVATADEVASGTTKRFSTATAVGFVSQGGGTLSAVSGVCTHQGCLLQLNPAAGRLDCPCHRTAFSTEGRLLFSQLSAAPATLPRLQARRNGDHIEVLLPPPT